MVLNGDYYPIWRTNRINKLITVLGGKEWFINKEILELGCTTGAISSILKSYGAIPTCAEGNIDHIKQIKENIDNVFHIDNDKEWNLNKKFDLVIHWGLLYHLNDWKNDLVRAINHAKILTLETEVLDTTDINQEIKTNENWDDGAINRIGTRMSPYMIEKILTESNTKFVRYDDEDLNISYHNYSWKDGDYNNGTWHPGVRRFWVIWT